MEPADCPIDRKLHNAIVSSIRKLSKQSKAYKACIAKATVQLPTGELSKVKKTPKTLAHVICAGCKTPLRKYPKEGEKKAYDIDHIDEVGPFKGCYHEYIHRILCAEENLQVLCKETCHKVKTSKYGKYLNSGADFL